MVTTTLRCQPTHRYNNKNNFTWTDDEAVGLSLVLFCEINQFSLPQLQEQYQAELTAL